MPLRFGAHMPTAGGLYKALCGGAKIGCDAVQIFTASPRQWRAKPLEKPAVRAFRRMAEATGCHPLIAHDSYLINLAAADPALVEKSRNAFLEEVQRAEELGLDYLVTHMGAHTGSGEEAGIARLCESLNWLHDRTPGYWVKVALETTAGQGTYLGATFDHFPLIFGQVAEADRLVVCLDTCHVFVAGYDIRTPETAKAMWDQFGEKVGFERLVCIHANDAEKGLGSKTDRHAHIGEGQIGADGFVAVLGDDRLPDNLPVIVETPEAETMHRVNVWRLRQMMAQNGKVSSP
ncbi:MAG: deoxyribonuclease IV [Armatimonadaceae bacterium]